MILKFFSIVFEFFAESELSNTIPFDLSCFKSKFSLIVLGIHLINSYKNLKIKKKPLNSIEITEKNGKR